MEKSDYEKQLLQWILNISTLEEFEKEIMSIIDRENNDRVTNLISNGLLLELEEISAFLTEEISLDDRRYFEERMDLTKEKLNIVTKSFTIYDEKRKHEQELEQIGGKQVLFATNKAGNVIVDRHLKTLKKNCSADVYQSFLDLIMELVRGEDNFNETKQKPLSAHLKGLYEKKDDQARVIYRYAADFVVIIGATLKKTDFDKASRELYINCKNQSEGYVRTIENGKVDINHLMEQSTEYLTNLFENEKKVNL